MDHRRGGATAVAILLLVAFAVPAIAGSGSAPDRAVLVHASSDRLDEIAGDEDFELSHDYTSIDWIAGVASGDLHRELARDDGVLVEDDRSHRLLCHTGNGDNGQCDGGGDDDDGDSTRATPDDQTPYGIEQIYDNSSLSATSGGSGVTLGHIDTGVDGDHPDLVNRIVFSDGDDKNGHGTHTAGTAAADAGSDGLGIYGVAPEASVRSYRVCNPAGLCKTSDIVAAIDDCTNGGDRKCDVITYSIGSDSSSSSISDAIDAFTSAGGLYVAAAGNDGSSLDSIDFPAWKDNTVAVAAIDSSKTVADFSSRGDDDGNCGTTAHDIDFAAAGVSVESTYPDDDYAYLDGTSMATPHVSGLALKEWAGNGADTYSSLQSNVEDITSGKHATSGCDPASGQGLPHVG